MKVYRFYFELDSGFIDWQDSYTFADALACRNDALNCRNVSIVGEIVEVEVDE